MRKKKIKLGDKEYTIDVYETEASMSDSTTVEEFRKKREKEKQFDAELDRLADEITKGLSGVNKDSRTLAYWEMGKLISDFIRRASSQEDVKREPYEAQNKAYDRLTGKIAEKLKGRHDVEKDNYSVAYLKKWERLSRKFTHEQAERPVPYPLVHELLYDELEPSDIDTFLVRCEKGEFDNVSLRKAVDEYRKGKKLIIPSDSNE